jgi:hypothetical protein
VDINSGSFQTASVRAVQTPAFFAAPQEITFSGNDNASCATGFSSSAVVTIFGGSPPYRVLGAGISLVIDPDVVAANGGSFRITPTGSCMTDQPISILDSAGRTLLVRVSNNHGTSSPAPFIVSPESATIDSCQAQVTFTATGGNGSYQAIPSNDSITQTAQSGNSFTFKRKPETTSPPSVSVTFVSGQISTGVGITMTTAAQGLCH